MEASVGGRCSRSILTKNWEFEVSFCLHYVLIVCCGVELGLKAIVKKGKYFLKGNNM